MITVAVYKVPKCAGCCVKSFKWLVFLEIALPKMQGRETNVYRHDVTYLVPVR